MDVPAVIMRGGTSKGVFFHEEHLPVDPAERDAFILAAFGSPDPHGRQIDGLGGATTETSKVAIISKGGPDGADVTYEFGQVLLHEAKVDREGNCGNISSAVGPFAVDEGLVPATDPVTKVRYWSTNAEKIIEASVPTRNGKFDPQGQMELPGVPGRASAIQLEYFDPSGSVTGKLLPTGNLKDQLTVPGLGAVEVSVVDAANPFVFVNWSVLGLGADATAKDFALGSPGWESAEAIRRHAAVACGLAKDPESAGSSVPKITFVSSPVDYKLSGGATQAAAGIHVRAVMMSIGHAHASYAFTGAICTAVAAGIPGTVVADCVSGEPEELLIGHPSGILPIRASIGQDSSGAPTVHSVIGYRTARRLMTGVVHVLPN